MLPAGQLPPIGHKGSCRASGAQWPPRAPVRRNRNTPLIQSRAVDLPPGMLLMSQLFLGALFGLLGLAVAAPLAAVTITVVKRSYVRDWLRRLR